MPKQKIDYNKAVDFLFNQLPAFERSGISGYKPGLETALSLSEIFGNPHQGLRCIHVAGTNGKGSVAHTLASVLSAAGYKTGLYTSPHLVDFRERIRIDGVPVAEDVVTDFVGRYLDMAGRGELAVRPSFFELTTIMAFEAFRNAGVDIAVVETGLGGRLDTTAIVTPLVSVITSVGLDHTDLLGNTLEAIAAEKAGIIKPGVPAVVCDIEMAESVVEVFRKRCEAVGSRLNLVSKSPVRVTGHRVSPDGATMDVALADGRSLTYGLTGDFQASNASTALAALDVLKSAGQLAIADSAVARGFLTICSSTGLVGRMTVLSTSPTVLCDTGHNPHAWQRIVPELLRRAGGRPERLRLVLGFVGDKDVASIVELLPRESICYLTAPSTHRALPASALQQLVSRRGIECRVYSDVDTAYRSALGDTRADEILFVGGSNYLLGELLAALS